MNIKKKHVSIGLLVLVLSLTVAGTVNQSFNPQSKLEIPKTSAGEITIVTPENKTYTEPMSGYYPATFGFENDADGSLPKEWVDLSGSSCTSTVISIHNNHKKVLNLQDISSINKSRIIRIFADKQIEGSIELWHQTNDSIPLMDIRTYNEVGNRNGFYLGSSNGQYRYGDGSSWHYVSALNSNELYHHRIEFHCTSHTFDWYINGILQDGGDLNYADSDCNDLKQLWLTTSDGAINYEHYFDAIGFSWDPNYNIGDNLNEGLLLSYDNNTTLDWQGYSLDGQANRTILGNTTIPMLADGLHEVQVFGNDTMGTMYESDARYFTVNTAPPEITINSPTDSQMISSTAPSYDISIIGPYDSIWYALEGGTNYTATGITGTIDQSAWSALSDGIITIDFYANNSAGMEGAAQVQVFKQTSEEPPPGIPGYDLYLLLGVISVISALIIRKRVKS